MSSIPCALRVFFSSFLLLSCAAETATALPLPKNSPPNVVVIIGDDMGWPDFGFLGNDRVHTPTLDMLARRGVLFTSGQLNASVCLPTHFSFLKGVHHDVPFSIPGMTLPRLVGRKRLVRNNDGTKSLVNSPYVTFQAGKLWTFGPRDWGFRKYAPEVEVPYPLLRGNPGWAREGWDPAVCGSMGSAGTDCPAMAEWREFLGSKDWKNGSRRFFAVLTPEIPHSPVNPPQV